MFSACAGEGTAPQKKLLTKKIPVPHGLNLLFLQGQIPLELSAMLFPLNKQYPQSLCPQSSAERIYVTPRNQYAHTMPTQPAKQYSHTSGCSMHY